jgi:hypothetical protein
MDNQPMNTLPKIESAFLSIHYVDRHSKLETWRIYGSDGQAHIYDGKDWRADYRLTPSEITQVQAALETCGVLSAKDISSEGVHDTATLTWEWTLPDGRTGTLQNRAYPAKTHPAMNCVMDMLLDIEELHLG